LGLGLGLVRVGSVSRRLAFCASKASGGKDASCCLVGVGVRARNRVRG
jgi:hypothetical protein